MKRLNLFYFILLGALISFNSCDKDEDDNNNNNATDVYLRCQIDGANFEADPLTVGGISSNNSLTVQGNEAGLDARAMTMVLNSSYSGVGTYGFGENEFFNIATYLPMATNPAEAYLSSFAGINAGQIQVTSDDGSYVEGTFQFNCNLQSNTSMSASITNGEFRLKLP